MKADLQTFALGLCIGLLAGCSTKPQSNYDAVALVEVSGIVKLDEKPLPDAVVKFEAADGQYSIGQTDADGKYSLRFDSNKSGVTPGEKTVRISTLGALGEGMEVDEAPPGETGGESQTQKKIELVPEKYNSKSELKETVKPTGSQTFDFDLKTNG